MNEVNRYLWRLAKWTFLALVIFMTFVIVAKAQDVDTFDKYGRDAGMMDYDGVNPGEDKQCLKYEDCPEWDGNADTKVYYDLMKLKNGTGVIAKSDFNWNVHLYTCHQNKLLDSINGEGAFERLAILSAKDGMIPCPIGDNPHWSYDWESHILKARLNRLTMLWPKKPSLAGPKGQQGLMNSTQDVE
jgi:hypothetical protein